MDPSFAADRPIYQQLYTHAVAQILEGAWPEGGRLPSVRGWAVELGINALTVLHAYRLLIEQELVFKRRGRGLFVVNGARQRLLVEERRRFLQHEWPPMRLKLERLGLSVRDLPSSE